MNRRGRRNIMKTERHARMLEVSSWLCLIPAIPGLLLFVPGAVAGAGLADSIPFLVVASLFAPGQALLIGSRRLSRGRALWCGERGFWMLALGYNVALVCLYAYAAASLWVLWVLLPLPLMSSAIACCALRASGGRGACGARRNLTVASSRRAVSAPVDIDHFSARLMPGVRRFPFRKIAMSRATLKWAIAGLILCATPLPGAVLQQVPRHAQHVVRGVVADFGGAAIPGYTLVFQSRGGTWRAVSDETGRYELLAPAGVYEVTGESPSFSFRRALLKLKPDGVTIVNVVPVPEAVSYGSTSPAYYYDSFRIPPVGGAGLDLLIRYRRKRAGRSQTTYENCAVSHNALSTLR